MSLALLWSETVSGKKRGPLRLLARVGLWGASLPYGAVIRLRNRCYDSGVFQSVRMPVPVISVGNLSLGGTGKTPCVEYVARKLVENGRRVAIVSRGYGAESGPNDEAFVLEDNLPEVPHLQDRDRIRGALAAIEELEVDAIVLDDGFQHRRLARDCDIVLVDATTPPQKDRLFPAGTLREPRSRLRRASAIIVTKGSDAEADETLSLLRREFPEKPIARARLSPQELITEGATAPLEECAGRPVAAFCGVGNPDSFRETVRSIAGEPLDFRPFPDHHAYQRADIDALAAWAAQFPAETLLLTTQKDFVKLRIASLGGRQLWAVRVAFEVVSGEESLLSVLHAVAPALEDDPCV